jgi:hypothetical protein
MRKQSSDQPIIASCARQNVLKSSRTSQDVRVFGHLIDRSCLSPTVSQFGGGRRDLLIRWIAFCGPRPLSTDGVEKLPFAAVTLV